jgi:ssDNA-binding Zn-finger/Zn-ribbon topoisomerase 1
MPRRKRSSRIWRKGYALCPNCRKRRGRWQSYPGQYKHDIDLAKCRNCGTEFVLWRGKQWLNPEQVPDLKQAMTEAGVFHNA